MQAIRASPDLVNALKPANRTVEWLKCLYRIQTSLRDSTPGVSYEDVKSFKSSLPGPFNTPGQQQDAAEMLFFLIISIDYGQNGDNKGVRPVQTKNNNQE